MKTNKYNLLSNKKKRFKLKSHFKSNKTYQLNDLSDHGSISMDGTIQELNRVWLTIKMDLNVYICSNNFVLISPNSIQIIIFGLNIVIIMITSEIPLKRVFFEEYALHPHSAATWTCNYVFNYINLFLAPNTKIIIKFSYLPDLWNCSLGPAKVATFESVVLVSWASCFIKHLLYYGCVV